MTLGMVVLCIYGGFNKDGRLQLAGVRVILTP